MAGQNRGFDQQGYVPSQFESNQYPNIGGVRKSQ